MVAVPGGNSQHRGERVGGRHAFRLLSLPPYLASEARRLVEERAKTCFPAAPASATANSCASSATWNWWNSSAPACGGCSTPTPPTSSTTPKPSSMSSSATRRSRLAPQSKVDQSRLKVVQNRVVQKRKRWSKKRVVQKPSESMRHPPARWKSAYRLPSFSAPIPTQRHVTWHRTLIVPEARLSGTCRICGPQESRGSSAPLEMAIGKSAARTRPILPIGPPPKSHPQSHPKSRPTSRPDKSTRQVAPDKSPRQVEGIVPLESQRRSRGRNPSPRFCPMPPSRDAS